MRMHARGNKNFVQAFNMLRVHSLQDFMLLSGKNNFLNLD